MATEEPATVEPELPDEGEERLRQARTEAEEETPDDDRVGGLEFQGSLVSCERLDRSSPDMWPSQSIGDFVDLRRGERSRRHGRNSTSPSSYPWNQPLTPEDIHLMQQLGNLSTSFLIIEVKKLHDLAYKLGVEEAKEMTRGKYLNVFKSRHKR